MKSLGKRPFSILVIAIQPPPLRRPPDAGKRKDGAGVVIGLVVNAGAQATGGRGTFSGWVSYAVEIEDAHTGTLLYAHVANRSANALDITANFGPLDAAKAGVRSAADKLDKELAGATR